LSKESNPRVGSSPVAGLSEKTEYIYKVDVVWGEGGKVEDRMS